MTASFDIVSLFSEVNSGIRKLLDIYKNNNMIEKKQASSFKLQLTILKMIFRCHIGTTNVGSVD